MRPEHERARKISERLKQVDDSFNLRAALQGLADAVENALSRLCGCYSVSEIGWHSDSCPVPQLRAALAQAQPFLEEKS